MTFALQRSSFSKLPRGLLDSRQKVLLASCAIPIINQHLQRRGISIDQLNCQKNGRERVVILGSGWAGFTVARRLDSKKFQAVVVSPRSYFVFTPLLASTSTGTLEFRTALEPIRSRRKQIEYFQGWADSVNFSKKSISVEETVDDPHQSIAATGGPPKTGSVQKQREKGELFDLDYDKLIISVGCYSQTFGTLGVREHAMFLKDVGDARKIRNRLLTCFETASLPTTSEQMKKHLLNFAVVGGGPTGIEFSAELHDLVTEDLARLYPDLIKYVNITVYDVAQKVLPMFDEKLGKYAMDHFKREGIHIKTSHHVESLRKGPPEDDIGKDEIKDDRTCFTLKVKEEGEIGVGMVVWSTGLMMNPFIEKSKGKIHTLPRSGISYLNIDHRHAEEVDWMVKNDPKTGGIVTDGHLRLLLEPKGDFESQPRAVAQDVFALGDCAVMENSKFPATAQVASQKAEWLGKMLNKGDLEVKPFHYKNLGVMAYVGDWKGILQTGGSSDISGRTAFLIWRGAYLTKAMSWRNKLLIPTYWFLNWLFGRDINRF